MVKDFADRNGVGEDGNKLEAAVAAGAVERIDVIEFCEHSADGPVGRLREQNGETDGTEVAAYLVSAEQCGPFETGKS